MGSHHQARPPGEGEQDQVPRGHLPLLHGHQGVPDRGLLPRLQAQGRGDEDHARAEGVRRRSDHPLQGLRRRRRRERPRRSRRQVRQGGGHGHPRRHHHRQDVGRARAPRLLGPQERHAPHRAQQGDRKVRVRARAPDPGPARDGPRGRPRAQEAPEHGRRGGLLHVFPRAHPHPGQLREGGLLRPRQDLRLPLPRAVEAHRLPVGAVPGAHRLPGQEPGPQGGGVLNRTVTNFAASRKGSFSRGMGVFGGKRKESVRARTLRCVGVDLLGFPATSLVWLLLLRVGRRLFSFRFARVGRGLW